MQKRKSIKMNQLQKVSYQYSNKMILLQQGGNKRQIYKYRVSKDQKLKQIQQQTQKSHQDQSRKTSRKTKTQPNFIINANQEKLKQFVTSKIDHKKVQLQELEKRIRVKEYVDRLKSMSPDQTTLQRIKKVKQQIIVHQKLLQLKNKQLQKSKKIISRDRIFSLKQLKKLKTQTNQNQSSRLASIEYSQNQRKVKRVKTQTISKKDLSINDNHKKVQFKGSQSIVSLPKNKNSYSLPSIQNKHYKLSPKKVENNRQYKNYLLDLKLKATKPISEYQKLKKDLKYPTEILREFGKKSLQIQKNIMDKIKDFKNMQLTQKYEKSLLKQIEVDQLFTKNLHVKLACLMDD